MSHYDWLEKNIEAFFASLNIPSSRANKGFIGAHGDKCYGYRDAWEKAGVPFPHGVAIYFLSYLHPYSQESRETKDGWVPVEQWVIANYERFKPHLNPAIDSELQKKIADAEANSSAWLGDGNEAEERGNYDKAEKCFDKAQFWLDRANKLRGWS